jgi:hypothetical protein
VASFSGTKNEASGKHPACLLVHTVFVLLGLLFDLEGGDDMFLRNVRLTFNGLHDIMSQKTEFFTTTPVRISNPTTSFTILPVHSKYRNWLRYYVTTWNVAGSTPDETMDISIDLILPAALWPWVLLSL